MADQTPQTPQGKLRDRALQIARWDLNSLLHPKDAGSFNFEAQKPLLENIQRHYTEVASANFEFLPANVIEGFIQRADSMIRTLTGFQQFSYRSGDPNQRSQAVINELGSNWTESYNQGAFHIAYARASSGALSGHISTIADAAEAANKGFAEAVKKFSDRAEELEKQEESRLAELDKTIAAAREASKIAGVAEQASAFDNEATSARNSSWRWLGATAIAIGVGLFFIWAMFLAEPSSWAGSHFSMAKTTAAASSAGADAKTQTAIFIQQSIARILIVTLIYSAVVWCARNYFASRHNYTVNRQRRNAMQTFRAFVAGSDDKATQDFILRQAAQCAFSPQQTGYLKDESLPTPGPASQIIDIVKPESK